MKLSLFFVSALLSVSSVSVSANAAEATPGGCAALHRAMPFYRSFSLTRGDHFYTTDAFDFMNAIQNRGYIYEGVEGFIFPSFQRGTIPLFRMWNPSNAVHLYTTDEGERMNARNLGYRDDRLAGFVYPGRVCDAIPLFRMVRGRDRLYTTSATEQNWAKREGYVSDGIAAWVLPTGD